MSRKSTATELQAEEAAVNSPIRRSSRIINGTSAAAAAITTRRTSQTEAPAKVTRTRRTSTQSNEEMPESKAAPLKKDIEQPKAVRTRRNSRANSEDLEVDAPKSSNVTVRKKLAKAPQKAPVRASARRRNSATEEEETLTPVKTTARGRIKSDAENLQDMEKDVIEKDNITPGIPKEDGQLGEVPKVALRRSRRLSTDDNLANTPPVVPRRVTRRSSISQDEEAGSQKLSEDTDMKKVVNPLSVKLTPIKKRKLVEVVESELDLSVINESVGDINSSPNQSTDQVFLKVDSPKSSRSGSTEKSPKSESSKATQYASPIRKSPRLSEKSLSPHDEVNKSKSDALTSSPKQSVTVDLQDEKPSGRNSANLFPNNSEDVVETNAATEVGSLKADSEIQSPTKSNNFGGSDKENIDLVEKSLMDLPENSIAEAPTGKARVSNVFKPNQKECSFMEPMEVDECSFSEAVDSGMETNLNLDQSSVIINKNVPICPHEKHIDTTDADVGSFKDSSSLFNKKIASDSLTERSTETSAPNNVSNGTIGVSSAAETSDNNVEKTEKINCVVGLTNNSSLETKTFPSRKSSSPIPTKKRLSRKSNSPVVTNNSANSKEDDDCNRLSVARRTRTSKSKSRSPVQNSRRSESKSPLPKTSSIGTTNVNAIRTSQSFSPILNTATEWKRSTVEQSFEKPMGSEEVLVFSGKICMNYNEESYGETTKAKNLEKTPNTSAETSELMKSIINDSTEKAKVELARNSADRNGSKHKTMDFTHYDFYLPSDDELLDESEVPASAEEKGSMNQSQHDHLVQEEQSTTTQENVQSHSIDSEYQALTQILQGQVVEKSKVCEKANVSSETAKLKSIEFKPLEQCQETNLAEDNMKPITSPAEKTDRRRSLKLRNIQEQSQDSNFAEESKAARASPDMEAAKRQSIDLKTTNGQGVAEGKTVTRTSMTKKAPKRESIELKKTYDQAAKQDEDDRVVDDGKESARTSLPKSSVEGKTIESTNKANADESETVEELELVSARAEDNGVDSPKVFQKEASESKNNSYSTFDIAESGKSSKIGNCAVLQHNGTFVLDYENESIDGVTSSETDLKIVFSDSNTETSQQEILSEDNINDADLQIVKDDSVDKSTVKDVNEETSHILPQASPVTPASSKNTKTQLEEPNVVLISSEEELSLHKSCAKDNSQIDKTDIKAELPETSALKLRESEHTNDSSNQSVVVQDSSSEEVVSPIELKNSELPRSEMSDIVHNQKCNNSENTGIELNESARKLEEENSESGSTKDTVKGVESSKKTPKKMNRRDSHMPTPEPAKESAKLNTKSPSPSKESRKESLHAFASSKLSEYLKGKLEEVLDSSEESECEVAYSEFIDGMAEEGEEDTPSEDSNAIPDEGESIGYSDSEVDNSDDDYDENDSFICDDDVSELLSGEEYDLCSEVKKETAKKSRIIDLDLISDADIIKIPRKKVDKKPKKRTRIIEISDSSSEAEIIDIPTTSPSSKCEDQSTMISTETSSTKPNDSIKDTDIAEDIKDTNSPRKSTVIEHPEVIAHSDLPLENISIIDANSSIQKTCRKSSLTIQENIVGVKDPLSTERISTLVESFCSAVTKGEISLNVSVEYEEHSNPANLEGEKRDCVNIISDVQIRSSNPSDESPEQVIEAECDRDPEFHTNSEGDVKSSKKRAKRKRKRSKSVSELCAETPGDQEPDFTTNSGALKRSEKKNKAKQKTNKEDSEEPEVTASSKVDVKDIKKRAKLKQILNNSAGELSLEVVGSEEPNFIASSKGAVKRLKKREKLKQRLNSSAGELCDEIADSGEPEATASSEDNVKNLKSRAKLEQILNNSAGEVSVRVEDSEEPNFITSSEGSKKGGKVKQRLSRSAGELYGELEDSEEPEFSANSEGGVKENQVRAKLKRRLSKSVSELQEEEQTTKRRKRNRKRQKASSLTLGEETNITKEKRKPDQLDDLRTQTFGLMNQLITDVKNRPKRTIKPSTSLQVDGSWTVSDTPDIKPSKSLICRREIIRMTTKLHPSDFKNIYLSDPKRVKRIETKDLLKKKGAYY